jgi:hypothetical protein
MSVFSVQLLVFCIHSVFSSTLMKGSSHTQVYDLYVNCLGTLYHPLRQLPLLCFKYLQGLGMECSCRPADKARLHQPQQAQRVYQQGLTKLSAKCTLLYTAYLFFKENVNDSVHADANKGGGGMLSIGFVCLFVFSF